MKMLQLMFLILPTIMNGYAQQPNTDDVAQVIMVLESYKKALEHLDTTGTGKLFVSKSVVIETGKNEGRYQDYLAHHLGPEVGNFKSLAFSDYKADVTVDLFYAFATETYKYTIVLKKDNSVIERKGAAPLFLRRKMEHGELCICTIHQGGHKIFFL
jgi:hypothetical protein